MKNSQFFKRQLSWKNMYYSFVALSEGTFGSHSIAYSEQVILVFFEFWKDAEVSLSWTPGRLQSNVTE